MGRASFTIRQLVYVCVSESKQANKNENRKMKTKLPHIDVKDHLYIVNEYINQRRHK